MWTLWTKCDVGQAGIHNYACHIICAKEFVDSNINSVVIDKISKFYEIAPNLIYSQKS